MGKEFYTSKVIKKLIANIVKREKYKDAFDAGQRFDSLTLDRYNLNSLKKITLFKLLKSYYGKLIKPWMMKRADCKEVFGTYDSPKVENIRQLLKFRSTQLGIEVKDLRQKHFRKKDFGYYSLLNTYSHKFHELLNIYYGSSLTARDYGLKINWTDQDIKKVIDSLLKKYEIKINEIPLKLNYSHFKKEKLMGLLAAKKSILEILKIAYPEVRFQREDFKYFNDDALLGKAFERICRNILSEMNLSFDYNKHTKNGRPDFTNVILKDIFKKNDIIDCKLRISTFFNSNTIKYKKGGRVLKILYLNDKELTSNSSYSDIVIEGVIFVHISRVLTHLKLERRNYYIEQLNEIIKQGIPEQLISESPFSSLSFCKLHHLDECTFDRSIGVYGVIIGHGFCVKHYQRFLNGYIDIDGNQLKDFKHRPPLELNNEQLELIKNNSHLTNKELARLLFGRDDKSLLNKVSHEIIRLKLTRTKGDFNKRRSLRHASKYLSFEDAKSFFQNNKIEIRSVKDWYLYRSPKNRGKYSRLPPRPHFIPCNLSGFYSGKGWKGYAHFFGYERQGKFVDINTAKKYFKINEIPIKSVGDWKLFRKKKNRGKFSKYPLKPDFIPSSIDMYYADKGWKGYPDFFDYKY